MRHRARGQRPGIRPATPTPPEQPAGFVERLVPAILARALEPALGERNVDPERFPGGMGAHSPERAATRLTHLLTHAEDIDRLAARLDARSRRRLDERLVYHVLGHTHARIGPTRAEVDRLLEVAHRDLIVESDTSPVRYAGTSHLHRFDLQPLGMPITLESYLLGVQGTFQLEQYRCPDHAAAWPRAGDVAIDGGACFGETALWLAHVSGPDGRVVSLEFAPGNLARFEANLEANPAYAERIALERAALWETSGESLAVSRDGPASSIAYGPGGADPHRDDPVTTAPTITLDDLVAAHGLPRVDFVKLDIEGAEPAALAGAADTLTRFRPRLALAAYHEIDHLWELPDRLDRLGLGYRFALGHFTMHEEETVLYAWTEPA